METIEATNDDLIPGMDGYQFTSVGFIIRLSKLYHSYPDRFQAANGRSRPHPGTSNQHT